MADIKLDEARLSAMRNASESLKGVERAAGITHAKPEFVDFIMECPPAAVLALLEQFDALRKAANDLLSAMDRADYGLDVYSLAPNLKAAANALRKALGKQ